MQHQPGPPEYRFEKGRKRSGSFAKLREDERLLLPGSDHFGDLAQARQLAAVGFAPRASAKPMRWVIANLFEAHQERQNNPFALDSIGPIEFRSQFFDGLLLERRLFTGELAECLDPGLVRQICNDR